MNSLRPSDFREFVCRCLALLLGCLVLAAPVPPAGSAAATASAVSDGVSVRGTQLARGGQTLVIKGVQIVAFVGTPPVLQQRVWYWNAHQNFGQQELSVAQAQWHANTVLFKLGEPELDPQSGLYSEPYIQEIRGAISLARSMGFVVIASVDELPPSGTASQSPLPGRSTLAAVTTLAKLFGADPGVMIEPYNEPFSPWCRKVHSNRCSSVDAAAWALWRDGSADGTFVGMNALIKAARDAGARNVILLQPLGHGADFRGFPGGITDPLGQLAYAVHPYFRFAGSSVESWERHFGDFASDHPLIADEWGATSGDVTCSDPPPQKALEFLQFIAKKNIGLIVWAIDLPGTIVADYRGTPSTFEGRHCGERGGGAGELIQAFFSGTLPASLQ